MKGFVIVSLIILSAHLCFGCKCKLSYEEQFGVPVEEHIVSKLPHEYIPRDSIPSSFDWRNVNGTSYVGRVVSQQIPSVCGSCWADAATGALTDRYIIATKGKLQLQLSVQQLLNFDKSTTGGSCLGGDSSKAYDFAYKYGIVDETCAPFLGVDHARGFEAASMTKVKDVQDHSCYMCDWTGDCGFLPRKLINIYGVDEHGTIQGEDAMKAEIYARGPIACSLNSEVDEFDAYQGGIITCDKSKNKKCKETSTDHVVVITGWGVDQATGIKYWVGRNSYGTRWGEGAGGGWFRLERGSDTLNMESHHCSWAVPAAADVERALSQFQTSL